MPIKLPNGKYRVQIRVGVIRASTRSSMPRRPPPTLRTERERLEKNAPL